MEMYRLSRKKFAGNLSGKGAALKGARWNSVGVEMIYTAANRSLAMAEVAVHFTLATLPADYVMMTILVPDKIAIQKMKTSVLPTGWNAFPYIHATQLLGDQFISENKFCLLQVPSAVTKGDYNFLLNPYHTDFASIKIADVEPFPFDERIFK